MRLHPSRGALLAWDAEELSPRRTRRIGEHLATCSRCRATLTRRREIRRAVRDVASPRAPDILERVIERLESDDPLLLPDAPEHRRPPPRPRRRGTVAAVVALLLTAGSAVAALGVIDAGMVRGWLGLDAPSSGSAPVTGVDVEVPASGIDVNFRDVGPGVVLAVTWGRGELLEVTLAGAGPEARFRIGDGGLRVAGVPEGEVHLSVPRSASGPVRVISGATVLVVVQDGVVRMRGRDSTEGGRAVVSDLLGRRPADEGR